MTNTSPYLVTIENLRFTRGDRVILNGIDLNIIKGKVTAIMGPSGTGKTTLLSLIGGQLQPDAGRVLVNGNNIHTLNRQQLYKTRRHMGMLFQSGALLTHLSVYDNVAFPLREHTNLPETMVRDLVLLKLQAVGLRGARNLMPSELSGGMARRVALARAMALDPELMMYDEPFTGLDPISKGVIVKLIHELNKALGLTSIVVSHDVAEISQIADYIYMISDTRVIAKGTPVDLAADETPGVKQFVHGLPDGVVPFHYPAKAYMEDILNHDE